MGGRGASSGMSQKNISFSPKNGDEITNRVSGRILSLGSNTVTIKGENGKTAGMVRDFRRLSTSSPQDQMTMFQFQRKSGVDLRSLGVENLYEKDGKIYIFNNTRGDYIFPKLKKTNRASYDSFEAKKKKLREAEKAGAYIVNYLKY